MSRNPNMKKIISMIVLIAFMAGGAAYYLSRPSLEEMVGQMIMTGFHGDGTNENDDNFIAVREQIKRG